MLGFLFVMSLPLMSMIFFACNSYSVLMYIVRLRTMFSYIFYPIVLRICNSYIIA
jgi:hypothetical protein